LWCAALIDLHKELPAFQYASNRYKRYKQQAQFPCPALHILMPAPPMTRHLVPTSPYYSCTTRSLAPPIGPLPLVRCQSASCQERYASAPQATKAASASIPRRSLTTPIGASTKGLLFQRAPCQLRPVSLLTISHALQQPWMSCSTFTGSPHKCTGQCTKPLEGLADNRAIHRATEADPHEYRTPTHGATGPLSTAVSIMFTAT
jgi:hypothetical protein